MKNVQEKITHPDFSYNNPEKVYKIAVYIKNQMKMNDDDGHGDEKESLKFVLEEYVDITELKDKLDQIDSEIVEYYKTNKVSFSDAPKFSFNDPQAVISNIATRIYKTRNSLVHSKSNSINGRYKPYEDEKILAKEIPLVKVIAEQIIIKTSEIIE